MEIRIAGLADLQEIADLLTTDGDSVEVWRERISVDLTKDNRRILVATVDQRVVGYGQLLLYEPVEADLSSNPPGWYLAGVTVDPVFRRQGIGEALTTARMHIARTLTDRLYYVAETDNTPTLRLHERLGFVVDSDSAPLPGTDQTGIRCRIDLTGDR